MKTEAIPAAIAMAPATLTLVASDFTVAPLLPAIWPELGVLAVLLEPDPDPEPDPEDPLLPAGWLAMAGEPEAAGVALAPAA
jgi:hypothetical protein